MLGTINNPKRWPADPPPTREQLKTIDKTLPAYGPDSNPRFTPAGKHGHDGMRMATGLSNAAAMSAGEPIGIRALL